MEASMSWIPQVGMEFDSEEDVWMFWLAYGGRMGFNVRKQYGNKNKEGVVNSRRLVCAKEGQRENGKVSNIPQRFRAETRTGCKARIGFVLMKETGKYQIHDIVSEHNHPLHLPETSHLLSSQRKISEAQTLEIELAEDCGIKPKATHELIGAHVGGSTNLGYTQKDHKNYLQRKRQRSLMYGEAGSLLRYFHTQTIENPSFQYSIQLDSEEQITNIFWADAKMLIDYASFGEVVAFDTTFGTNKEHRPLGVFVGFNHFREVVIFGAALLYDETTESFKWLFETFLATHDGKKPKTIFTDQDIAMGNAIDEIMPEASHGLCTWHIMQNATKHLIHDGSNVLQDFKACMYDYDTEAEFESAFSALREKVKKISWMDSIYVLKKKWAQCYMKDIFSLGMRSTQLIESLNRDLKDYLHCKMDIMRFFRHFERVVRQKRQNEINSEFESRERLPRMKMKRTPLLRQVGQLYTPKFFEAFQDEYDWSTAAYIKPPVEGQPSNEYQVAISSFDDNSTIDVGCTVLGDCVNQTVSCSCKMFDRLGILCSHALKVLDAMNIKLVPEKYILKRWTKEAQSGTVRDISGHIVVDDPQLNTTRRYRALCRKFVNIASRAANFEESSLFLDNKLNAAIEEVDKMLSSVQLQGHQDALLIPDLNASVQQSAMIPQNVVLKKKEGRKGGKRLIGWNEKMHRRKKKSSVQASKGESAVLNPRKKKQAVQNQLLKEVGDEHILHQQQNEPAGFTYQHPRIYDNACERVYQEDFPEQLFRTYHNSSVEVSRKPSNESNQMVSSFHHLQDSRFLNQDMRVEYTNHNPQVFLQNNSTHNHLGW